jgi:hypothetical protein
MNTKELLIAIKDFFDESGKKQRNKKKYLKQVLAKLKHQKRKLRKKLDAHNNAKDRKAVRKELDIICAQHKKGLKLLKSLSKD